MLLQRVSVVSRMQGQFIRGEVCRGIVLGGLGLLAVLSYVLDSSGRAESFQSDL